MRPPAVIMAHYSWGSIRSFFTFFYPVSLITLSRLPMANGARRLQGVGSLLCGVVLLDGVLGAQVGEAATYYVATTGSDSNTCVQAQSPSTPKQTINAALKCLGTAAGAGAEHT